MNDTIYRQAAIDAVRKCSVKEVTPAYMLIDKAEVMTELMMLPSAQQWIPCSKLPTENGPYLVWMPFAPEKHHITVAEWCGSYWNIKTPITAYMPLPKPWEGEKDE